ncbi:phosphoribosylformylglycinamidine synthase [Acidaminobacter sp. JC074]|uniref:phosphoribosylformylglycinamidine synthase n=1 Tax=Acidaminobacter sp. JC074 TaxID=2530199 RepID=UPI001F103088|nr:phosphoribosylformylglycinamidine synthase [Acidaminobacter sp. JC074]MCH4889927.1 phosphoribosylformylglycinamidine synthase [Acidaminobacter sp. JC074]
MVRRIFVEKKKGFTVEGDHLLKELNENLNLDLSQVRVINCYEIENMSDEIFEVAKENVFSEPNVDLVYENTNFLDMDFVFRVQLLPGQYDQRADSAEQCVQLITGMERPLVESSKIIAIEGDLSDDKKAQIKKYLINPVESHEIGFEKKVSLKMVTEEPELVKHYDGFRNMDLNALETFRASEGFAMSKEDLEHIRKYFETEDRDPTVTELKAIDTYWSDHCRHTTFFTEITDVEIEDNEFSKALEDALELYYSDRKALDRLHKPVSLMDLGTIAAKKRRQEGHLEDLDISEEINACSIEVKVDVDGREEDYLVMFKNETHNHPTEIEPFGGAATCLGGAIRDPLSGRAYVYQAMRITGASDPRKSIDQTLAGKLPQRTITTGATKGYSSYGNQIGVTTGHVKEYYHDGFLAKRMEVGAVIAATPKSEVIREVPCPGDVVLLVGGLTGRDGCGGATGSSKEHTEDSILECGSEVQKGNAPVERKLQRLFRNETLSRMIKRCNDFGAGGVSVAIGEIADSLDIRLDAVPKKYEGLDGTELAISESQERMAVVVTKEDAESFIKLSEQENLEAVHVADVTDSGRLIMSFKGQEVFNIKRDFLDTNGVTSKMDIKIVPPTKGDFFEEKVEDLSVKVDQVLSDLNVCSQKGMVEHFDATIGASSVLMPFGGKRYQTPTEGMVAKIPVKGLETKTATIMTHGYHPDLALWSPFHGGMYAVVDSVAKVVAMGGDYRNVRLTFQEYFEKLGRDSVKWGKPMAALLGAHVAQDAFKTAAIGGKDSMSGTFKDIHVPPTLISFAVAPVHVDDVITPEFKEAGSKLVLFEAKRNEDETLNFDALVKMYESIQSLIKDKKIISAYTISEGGAFAALSKMAFGNGIGFDVKLDTNRLFERMMGSIVVEMTDAEGYEVIGQTREDFKAVINGQAFDLEKLEKKWSDPLSHVFPISEDADGSVEAITYHASRHIKAKQTYDKPKVVIPAFPGTNCEDDTRKAFEKVGAEVEVVLIRNLKSEWIQDSIASLEKAIRSAQIVALPGGFSAGDEPDGSGKFIASVFKNDKIKAAISDLLDNRDGLMIGICNGFQALVKLGLLPYGQIQALDHDSPTLTYNKIGRHVARYAKTRIASNLSPWLRGVQVGDIHEVALSHGEGRFYASEDMLKEFIQNGQIATQYVDESGKPSYDGITNPNGSLYAIEGLTSKDGRILGKMGHSERVSYGVAKNIYGEKEMKIFEAGVNYFRGL